jgi:hypothetical protein
MSSFLSLKIRPMDVLLSVRQIMQYPRAAGFCQGERNGD